MNSPEEIKEIVKQKYSEIALNKKSNTAPSCCCSTKSKHTPIPFSVMTDNYIGIEGYSPEADLGLGCGLPTQYSTIKKGDVVVDLGSGAGNDCFVARAETGDTGKVIGIDFTPAMIDRARINTTKLGYNNVEFILGDLENIPLPDNFADVIVSNCVLNLVPNKQKVFNEIYRVLKVGGHFSISDIVVSGKLPDKIKQASEMYAGCIASAISLDDYIDCIHEAGFQCASYMNKTPIIIPDEVLINYLSTDEISDYKSNPTKIESINFYADK